MGLPVLGGSEALAGLYEQGVRLAVNAVGGIGNVAVRVKVFGKLAEAGFSCPAIVHPTAFVEASARLTPGAVLVTSVTDSAFNVLLTQVAGLVTENGGGMSHAALMARELGIPAIIGAPAAMAVPDGARIELDPVAGLLRIIDADRPGDHGDES